MKIKQVSVFILFTFIFSNSWSQQNFKLKYKNSLPYAGIEVGSKGVKMTILEIGKNQQKNGTMHLLQDTSVNTDFISFTPATFSATLKGFTALYNKANKEYNIPAARIFTAISSGVKILSEKENKMDQVTKLTDSFRTTINEPSRLVTLIDVVEEARLSHLGIIPESRRYNTFLIDIGSGNTKGGYFPNGNTRDIRLFQLTWGTKSVTNETVKRVAEDKPLSAYNRQLLIKILRPLGFEVKEASNGKEAIAIWDKWEPHLIWMDMRMPVMDGYEATRYIKSTTKGNATAVIALTASSTEEEGTIVLSAGCDDFLRKPFKEQIIFDTLTKHLGVKYIYEQIPAHEHEVDIFQETSISSENLKIMPDQWIVRLYQSALEADKSLVMQIIEEIPDQQTFLVRSLIKLARNFQFEKLIDLAEPLLPITY